MRMSGSGASKGDDLIDIFKAAESAMGMDDQVWARHANPISVYTRLASAAPLFFALYSGHWIGWWALVPIAVMIIWTILNPRLFLPPQTTDNWATRGVLGERVFLNRREVPIPGEHIVVAHVATTISAVFLVIAVFGFVGGNFWAAFSAFFGSVIAKVWFVDRMAWLWDDMKDTHPTYAAWSKAHWTAKMDGKT